MPVMTGKKSICAALGAGTLLCAPHAFATSLTGNVAPWVAAAARTGTVPATRSVSILVHMALRNTDALTALAKSVSTPGSGQYGRYLTTAQFASRFAPAAADVAAVRAMLADAGMTNVTAGPIGAYVSATATVAQLRQVFGVSQALYTVHGRTLRANAEAPAIPASLAGKILYIEGLDETDLLRHPMHIAGDTPAAAGDTPAAVLAATIASGVIAPPVADNPPSPYCSNYYGDTKVTLSTKPGPYPKTMPWVVCGYTPQQAQQAYGNDKVSLDGSGVTVGILDAYASPTLKADENVYSAAHGLPKLTSKNFKQIIPQGIYDVSPDEPCGPQGWFGEQSLDVAAVHGSAPGAKIVYIGSRDCEESLTVAAENAIYNHQADILTNSYGNGGESDSAADIAAQDQAYMAAGALGITVLFSSGDDGDLSQDNGVATGSYPATSPYVTAVGGTSLALTDASGNKSEYGWGTYYNLLGKATIDSSSSVTTTGLSKETIDGTTYADFIFYAGSGGGVSLIEPQPAYQAGIVPAALSSQVFYANGYSVPLSPHRVDPDISVFGDPNTGYIYGESYTDAGNAADFGCTPETATTEYCERRIGGTSLSSPFLAGIMAIVNEQRGRAGRPYIGFANPWLYSLDIGASLDSAGVSQVLPPAKPTSELRGYDTNLSELRVFTLNSVPKLAITSPFPLLVCGEAVCEGIDDVFNQVTAGYNNTTGLGVPYVPDLIND